MTIYIKHPDGDGLKNIFKITELDNIYPHVATLLRYNSWLYSIVILYNHDIVEENGVITFMADKHDSTTPQSSDFISYPIVLLNIWLCEKPPNGGSENYIIPVCFDGFCEFLKLLPENCLTKMGKKIEFKFQTLESYYKTQGKTT